MRQCAPPELKEHSIEGKKMNPAEALITIVVEAVANALPTGKVALYPGTAPASANAAPAGTRLALIPFGAGTLSAPTPRKIVIAGPMPGTAEATGVIGWARILNYQDAPLGDLPLSALTLSTPTTTAGLIVTVTQITIEVP